MKIQAKNARCTTYLHCKVDEINNYLKTCHSHNHTALSYLAHSQWIREKTDVPLAGRPFVITEPLQSHICLCRDCCHSYMYVRQYQMKMLVKGQRLVDTSIDMYQWLPEVLSQRLIDDPNIVLGSSNATV